MIVWGAPGAGKTSIALRLGLAERFHGDEAALLGVEEKAAA